MGAFSENARYNGYILKEDPHRYCLPLNFEIIKVLFKEDFKKAAGIAE